MEFSPEDMLLGVEETEDEGDLEAELLALTGEAGTTGRKPAPKGQGEFATLGAGTRWAQAGGWRGLSSQLRGASQITWSLCIHVPSAASPPRGHLALLTYCVLCGGSSLLPGLHPLPLDSLSLWAWYRLGTQHRLNRSHNECTEIVSNERISGIFLPSLKRTET